MVKRLTSFRGSETERNFMPFDTILRGVISWRREMQFVTRSIAVLVGVGIVQSASGQAVQQGRQVIQPDSARFSQVLNGRVSVVDYRGRRAVKLTPSRDASATAEDMLAILGGKDFKDGTIDVDVAGAPLPGASEGARGFIGLAFRSGDHGEWSEIFYLRPTNGRADDQLRRNQSVQYVSHPDWTWHRLRDESPGVYESYADLEPGVWTHMKIVVAGKTARLYVNNAARPCLVVNDLKHGDGGGRVAFWAQFETDAYFGSLSISSR